MIAPADWPELSRLYGLHPRDVRVPPEQGGLTNEEVAHYRAALDAHREERKRRAAELNRVRRSRPGRS